MILEFIFKYKIQIMKYIVVILLVAGIYIIASNNYGFYNTPIGSVIEAMYLSTDMGISMNDVFVCVVLIGLLGAVMDTSIANTTAVYEVHRNNKLLGLKELMQSGRNVGKDILGTTANTLLFAGMGEVIMLFI